MPSLGESPGSLPGLGYDFNMDGPELSILQAASNILNATRPDRRDIQTLTSYADEHFLPSNAWSLPLDELATIVAMKLMHNARAIRRRRRCLETSEPLAEVLCSRCRDRPGAWHHLTRRVVLWFERSARRIRMGNASERRLASSGLACGAGYGNLPADCESAVARRVMTPAQPTGGFDRRRYNSFSLKFRYSIFIGPPTCTCTPINPFIIRPTGSSSTTRLIKCPFKTCASTFPRMIR